VSEERLRFTGEWPPPSVWDRYPNWEHALDEESVDGQDETTLRPSSVQTIVDEDAAFTAGEVVQADGTKLPALIELLWRKPVGVSAFVTSRIAWNVRELGGPARWKCTVQDWLPEGERQPSVSFSDTSVFPLEVRFRLPHVMGSQPLRFVIRADGSMNMLT
jgi:hypothetical protein